jgi:hypothetical protein
MGFLPPNINASGITFAQWQADGAVGHLEALLTANAAGTTIPSGACSVSQSATAYGSFLNAGSYYAIFTEVNGIGETTGSAESAIFTCAGQANPVTTATVAVGSNSTGTLSAGGYKVAFTFIDATTGGETTAGTTESAFFSIASGNTPVVTFNTGIPAFASGINLYATLANGTTGAEVLYATGVTTTTYTMSTSAYANTSKTLPLTNKTSVNTPLLTFPALQSGNIGRNAYLTSAGGGTGTETLYATGITTSTLACTMANPVNSWTTVVVPTVNSTGMSISTPQMQLARSFKNSNFHQLADFLSTTIRTFNAGSPKGFDVSVRKLQDVTVVIALLNKMCAEANVLMQANPGTIKTVTGTGIGNVTQKRSWP